ncbi:MAG: protein-methionine-sulfoxide reductase catalytic subunit MsrP [Longimicrobiales bacterium]
MIIRKPDDIKSSEITPESVYVDRRQFLRVGAAGAIGAIVAPTALSACNRPGDAEAYSGDVSGSDSAASAQGDKQTSYEDVTTYNNYYEFGTDKSDPARNAHTLKTRPWSVAVEGLVKKPAVYRLEDFIKPYRVEDRVYRHRCVEAWSMVIPWRGFMLRDLIAKVEPDPRAKYVEFVTLNDPKTMPFVRTNILDWPYVEGLRMDEAMNSLTLLATGLYGKDLPNQNGAPLRLVVPWKYGFKGAKSIVKIRFVEKEPKTAWNKSNPGEYGFYSNVNPNVDHPRWSQSKERRIGGGIRKRDTLMFNGYGAQVASMYTGMDLKKYY